MSLIFPDFEGAQGIAGEQLREGKTPYECFEWWWMHSTALDPRAFCGAIGVTTKQIGVWFNRLSDEWSAKWGYEGALRMYAAKAGNVHWLTSGHICPWAVDGSHGFIFRESTDAEQKELRAAVDWFKKARKATRARRSRERRMARIRNAH